MRTWLLASLFALGLLAVGVSADAGDVQESLLGECWQRHIMPPETWSYDAWLCVYGDFHGWIRSTAPTGHPSAGNRYKVQLDSLGSVMPYPTTYSCYLANVSKGSKWIFKWQVTLTIGQHTEPYTEWWAMGCPPIKFWQRQGGSPPQARTAIDWSGFG